MVAPFGFGVGDFLAVGSLAYRVITALNDSQGSKAEYKDLISVLSSLQYTLKIVSTHFLELASSGGADAAICNGIKHQLSLCTTIMEDFLLLSQRYTESLLPNDGKKNFRIGLRKVAWCLFKKEDVQKLQAALQSHIQAFMMLTSAVTGECLSQTRQLTAETHATTARIEQQLSSKFAMLMSVVKAPPKSLGYTWEGGWAPEQAPIVFEDALGRSFPIPLVFCRTMNAFHEALKIIFLDLPGQKWVARREYEMMDGSEESSIIQESDWQLRVLPGGRIAMNMLLRMSSSFKGDPHMCPKCGTENQRAKPTQGILRCFYCQLAFRMTDEERITNLSDPDLDLHKAAEKLETGPMHQKPEIRKHQREEDSFRRVHYLRDISSSYSASCAKQLLMANGIDPNRLTPQQFTAFQRQSPITRQKSIMLYAQSLASFLGGVNKPLPTGMPNIQRNPPAHGPPMTTPQTCEGAPLGISDFYAGGAEHGSHTLQYYQMQLMLLEQQHKRRLAMARAEQDGLKNYGDGQRHTEQRSSQSTPPSSWATPQSFPSKPMMAGIWASSDDIELDELLENELTPEVDDDYDDDDGKIEPDSTAV